MLVSDVINEISSFPNLSIQTLPSLAKTVVPQARNAEFLSFAKHHEATPGTQRPELAYGQRRRDLLRASRFSDPNKVVCICEFLSFLENSFFHAAHHVYFGVGG